MGTFHSGLSSARKPPEAQSDNKRGRKGESLEPWGESWAPGEGTTKGDKMQGK